MQRIKVLFPIGAKLIISFALILFLTLIIFNSLSSSTVARNMENIIGETNATTNSLFAVELENNFNMVRKEVHLLLDFIRIVGKDSFAARQASTIFFERSYFIAAVCVPGYIELVDDFFFISNNVNPGDVSSWISRENSRIQRAREGEPVISNPSAELGVPLIALFYPWQQNESEETVIILFSPDGLAEIFGAGDVLSFVINNDADVLVHSNSWMVLSGSNISKSPLVSALLNTDKREIRMIYSEGGVKYFGAGKKLSLANMMIFSSTEFENSSRIVKGISSRNIFLIISFVFISVVLIWLLSKTITVPVQHLIKTVSRFKIGQFEEDLSYRFPDEIGMLTEKIDELGKSLIKREQLYERRRIESQ